MIGRPWRQLRSDPTAALCRVVVLAACVYLAQRAAVIRVDYCDGFAYLRNARALVGPVAYDPNRAPLVSLAFLPIVPLVSARAPGAVARIVIPHVPAVLLSLGAAVAVFAMLARALGARLALAGAALFVASRLFLRYGAFCMADLLSAGMACVAVLAYLRLPSPSGLRRWLGLGVLLGLAGLAKYPLVTLGPGLLLGDLWLTARQRRRPEAARLLGFAAAGAAAAATFVGVHVLLAALHAAQAGVGVASELARVRAELLSGAGRIGGDDGERPLDYLGMVLTTASPLLLPLAAVGVLLAWRRPEARDAPMLGWLLVVGGTIVLGIGHNEARYALPALPPLLYLALRAVGAIEAHRPRVARVVLAVLVVTGVAQGAHQVVLDSEHFFTTDVEARVVRRLLAARRPGGRLVWSGPMHTLHTARPAFMAADEYWNLFHFAPWMVDYLGGEEAVTLDEPTDWQEGDVVVRAGPAYLTRFVPAEGAPALRAQVVRRRDLARSPDGRRFASSDGRLVLELAAGPPVALTPREDSGEWELFLVRPDAPPRSLGRQALRAGQALPLGGEAAGVGAVILIAGDARML